MQILNFLFHRDMKTFTYMLNLHLVNRQHGTALLDVFKHFLKVALCLDVIFVHNTSYV
jgi:hypothetical protein